MAQIQKGTILTYHNQHTHLDGVRYEVLRVGSKKATLEPVYGQKQLIGQPTLRQPFQIDLSDLMQAIEQGIYTLPATEKTHSALFLSSGLYKSGITTIRTKEDRETVLDSLVQDFGYGSIHHIDDPATNLQPEITAEEAALIDRLINECIPAATDEERSTGASDFDIYQHVNDLVKYYQTVSELTPQGAAKHFVLGEKVVWTYTGYDRKGNEIPKTVQGEVVSINFNTEVQQITGFSVLLETGQRENFTYDKKFLVGFPIEELSKTN